MKIRKRKMKARKRKKKVRKRKKKVRKRKRRSKNKRKRRHKVSLAVLFSEKIRNTEPTNFTIIEF